MAEINLFGEETVGCKEGLALATGAADGKVTALQKQDPNGTIQAAQMTTISEGLQLSEQYGGAHADSSGSVVGLDSRDAFTRNSAVTEGGSAKSLVVSPAPRNDDGERQACMRLVRVLNDQGADWGPPTRGDEPADQTSVSGSNPKEMIHFQVGRLPDEARFTNLGRSGESEQENKFDFLANLILNEVAVKTAKYSNSDRAGLTLVLDGTFHPELLLRSFVDDFVSKHSANLAECGFAAVWLVGPDGHAVNHPAIWRLHAGKGGTV